MEINSVCILGLGYIGLPTAATFAMSGLRVVGVDINRRVVDSLNSGKIHIEEPGLEDVVREAVLSGRLSASTDPVEADAFIIAVPTPIREDHSADLRAVESAAKSLLKVLKRGNLVILESTSPPGTTLELVRPILEQTGLIAGQDFLLCYSPERVLPGRILIELVQNDRVVGGIETTSAEAGRQLYARFVQGRIFTTNATTAEMVKVMENTFRDVNIALANEFALISEKLGVDVWEAISLANHHPRVNVLRPGPGVGGHCIAVDPWFLVQAAPEEAKIIRLAREVNDGMPHHVLSLVHAFLAGAPAESFTVACFGLTFKANVDDIRESPALHVAQMLVRAGFRVRCYDPHVAEPEAIGGALLQTPEEALEGADLMLVLVDHKEFELLSPEVGDKMNAKRVIDTRNLLVAGSWIEAGFDFRLLGSSEAH